jgi:hypothetical protein
MARHWPLLMSLCNATVQHHGVTSRYNVSGLCYVCLTVVLEGSTIRRTVLPLVKQARLDLLLLLSFYTLS